MFNLIIGSMTFGFAVLLIDYSVIGVAVNVALGVLNFGIAMRDKGE